VEEVGQEKEKPKDKKKNAKEKKEEEEEEEEVEGLPLPEEVEDKGKGKDESTDEEEDSGNESENSKLIRRKSIVAGIELPRFERIKDQQKDQKKMQIAFNTTDLPEVRQSLVEIVKSLLQNPVCDISVGLISNSGVKADSNINLHNQPFSKNVDEISKIITDSFGEGKNWEQYYRLVLEKAATFKWTPKPPNQSFLILVGSNDSVEQLTTYLHQHHDFNNSIGRLNTSGVGVFAFNHEQLDLLAQVVSNLS